MSIDPVIITLVSAILAGIGAIIIKLHINRCNLCCINSDCRKSRNNSLACLEEVAVEPTPTAQRQEHEVHLPMTANPPNPTVKISDV